jgi:hypothetical protein
VLTKALSTCLCRRGLCTRSQPRERNAVPIVAKVEAQALQVMSSGPAGAQIHLVCTNLLEVREELHKVDSRPSVKCHRICRWRETSTRHTEGGSGKCPGDYASGDEYWPSTTKLSECSHGTPSSVSSQGADRARSCYNGRRLHAPSTRWSTITLRPRTPSGLIASLVRAVVPGSAPG